MFHRNLGDALSGPTSVGWLHDLQAYLLEPAVQKQPQQPRADVGITTLASDDVLVKTHIMLKGGAPWTTEMAYKLDVLDDHKTAGLCRPHHPIDCLARLRKMREQEA